VKIMFVLGGATLLACAAKAPRPTEERLARGERAYQKCFSCHALEPGRNDLSGPTLYGIVGRPVAAEAGFGYSPAMRRLSAQEPRWIEQLLDRFVSDPQAVVPGTSMTFDGIGDAEERKALIAFLEHQTKAKAASFP
jgi:cytochrome c